MDTTLHIETSEARAPVFAKPQKAFAVAFAVLAATLAGCASIGGKDAAASSGNRIAQVEEGTVVAVANNASQPGFAYTIRLPTGELVSVAQPGTYALPTGTAVLVEYGADARVIPQGFNS